MSENEISLLPLGGGNEIGANCYYLRIGECGILIDAGMHPIKTGYESLPDFSLIENCPVDHLIISHAHQDHIGALPYAIKRFPYLRIYCTPQTAAIARFALHNATEILLDNFKDSPDFKIFSHDEIELLLRTIIEVPYNQSFTLKGFSAPVTDAVEVQFTDAGHILGSCGVLIKAKNHALFYTGDISLTPQNISPAAELPPHRVETLLMECTHGATDSVHLPDWDSEAERFAAECNHVFSANGSVLLPVFAIGKTQELLSLIWEMMEKGKIVKVPIYTGGLGRKINKIYDKNRYLVKVQDTDVVLRDIPQESINGGMTQRDIIKNPCIILASSGMMMPKTASYALAETILQQPNCAVGIVGYMDPQTPGYVVANANKGDTVRLSQYANPLKVECSILRFRFSAHSRREDLLSMVDELKPANVILTHGEPDSIAWIGGEILKKERNIKVYSAEAGKKIQIHRF